MHCYCSVALLYPTLCNPGTAACQASLSITICRSLLKLRSTESVKSSSHLILCLPLLFLPSIFPTSGSFPMSWLFTWGSQSIGVSTSASVLPMNIQDQFPLGLIDFVSFQSKGLSIIFTSTTVQKHNSSTLNLLYGPTLTCVHDYWKNHSFDYMDLCW